MQIQHHSDRFLDPGLLDGLQALAILSLCLVELVEGSCPLSVGYSLRENAVEVRGIEDLNANGLIASPMLFNDAKYLTEHKPRCVGRCVNPFLQDCGP